MGRYFSGDIGKFWFGVQASDDASFFGGEVNEPTEIEYSFLTLKKSNINLAALSNKYIGENSNQGSNGFPEGQA